MGQAVLDDRGVVEVGGPDARDMLQRLLTNDVSEIAPGQARYAALLTPQGKILADFFVVGCEGAQELLIDCPGVLAADLARRLTLYRLRARVTVTDRGAELCVAAFWPDPPGVEGHAFRDPRHDALGFRVIAPRDSRAAAERGDVAGYHANRIRAGVPEGGVDFAYGDAFPHDANLDRLSGVDFRKGCYVGQEVVSRVEHRGTARKRVTPIRFAGAPPPAGADVMAGEAVIGTMGSGMIGRGLALIRVDRAADAAASGVPLSAGGTPIEIEAA